MRDYQLLCTGCGARFDDDGVRLSCPNDHAPALLRTLYAQRRFAPSTAESIARYDCWLPTARDLAGAARTGIYRSPGLGPYLGLDALWIAFSGWWPERRATLPTGSFKDLEALAVMRRIAPGDTRTLVISSAGNTALAFARVCTENDLPALIVVPLRGWQDVMSKVRVGPSVRIVALADAGYEDAIGFARELCAGGDFVLEGGVRNVARRDGMGTAMLAAVETIGALPDYYVQAVGSAAGALAAHEAALRLVVDGRFGSRVPRLVLAQNAPFAPLHAAWQAGSPALLDSDSSTTARALAQLDAFVLGNQAPPYALPGGVREALLESHGSTYAIDNDALGNARALFSEVEGIDIEPAAGVAVAALVAAVRSGAIDPQAVVLLHVTGGGRRALRVDGAPAAEPTLVLARSEPRTTALDRTRSLLDHHV
jgi:cysteate synthase